MLGVRVQLSQPGLEAPVRCARHNLLWDAIPGTNSRQLERVFVLVGPDKWPYSSCEPPNCHRGECTFCRSPNCHRGR